MLGFRFIKTQPTEFVIQYHNGKPKRAGAGLAFWYFAPTSAIMLLPTSSVAEPFVFHEVTADFQQLSVQGQFIYRIAAPSRTAEVLNFAIGPDTAYLSDDPEKVSQRLIDEVQVAMRSELQRLPLRTALTAGDALVRSVFDEVRGSPVLERLGLELLSLSILAIKPVPETARALEAEAREALLRRADEAIYTRRNAAVEQERAIKENELATEVALENKRREVREAEMAGEALVQERRIEMERAAMAGKIALEEQNRELVGLAAENARAEAEAKAFGVSAMMQAFAAADPKILQALASVGMQPGQLMAQAFRELADNAGKIGQLNVSPEFLREMMRPRS